jgi:hypothetical protein
MTLITVTGNSSLRMLYYSGEVKEGATEFEIVGAVEVERLGALALLVLCQQIDQLNISTHVAPLVIL